MQTSETCSEPTFAATRTRCVLPPRAGLQFARIVLGAVCDIVSRGVVNVATCVADTELEHHASGSLVPAEVGRHVRVPPV